MNDDLISRQAAIDALREKVFHNLSDEFYGAMQALDELPSAQPEPTEEQVAEYCKRRCLHIVTDDFFQSAQPETLTDEILNDAHNEGYDVGYWAGRRDYEQKWIPVSERLPEDSYFVLMTIRRMDERYNNKPFISVGYISWNQLAWWCVHDGDCKSHNVIVDAWMPLPEPYTAESEET